MIRHHMLNKKMFWGINSFFKNAHSSDFAPQSIVVMLSKVETLTGIEEVMKICELRMRDLVIDESGYSRLWNIYETGVDPTP